jgi:hypothetical protein
MIVDWGFNGSFFELDMVRIESTTRNEARKFRYASNGTNQFVWQRSTSVHPHMVGEEKEIKERSSASPWGLAWC